MWEMFRIPVFWDRGLGLLHISPRSTIHQTVFLLTVASVKRNTSWPSIWMNASVALSIYLSLKFSLLFLFPSFLVAEFPSALWITACDPAKMKTDKSFQESDLGPVLPAPHLLTTIGEGEHFHISVVRLARQHFLHDGYKFTKMYPIPASFFF